MTTDSGHGTTLAFHIDKYRTADLLSPDDHHRLFVVERRDPLDIGLVPYDRVSGSGNLFTYGGVSLIWELVKDVAVDAFDNTNSYLGVGDSNTAAAATQTDLQAATNKVRAAMTATFPTHTDGTTLATHAQIVYKSTFAAGTGTFTWNEFGLFNASSGGRMLNRKVITGGAKGAGDSWTLAVTLSIT
jgi:hypothetical protein